MSFPNGAREGSCNELRISVRNQSNTPVTSDFLVEYIENNSEFIQVLGQTMISGGIGANAVKTTTLKNMPFRKDRLLQVRVDWTNGSSPGQIAESNETNNVWSGLQNSTLAGYCASFSIGDASALEGQNVALTVTLSAAVTHADATVGYATANGTATGGRQCEPGVDFIHATGTLSFRAGETSKRVSVTTCTDSSKDPDETFTVTLGNATRAAVGHATASATIR